MDKLRLRISRMNLTSIEIHSIEHILNRLETIELSNVIVHDDFYDNFLQHCTNLKRLSIENVEKERCKHIFGTETQWMLRRYSKLERFGLKLDSIVSEPYHCTALQNFFIQNPNIRISSTNRGFILSNHQSMLKSNIKFHRLIVEIDWDVDSVCRILKTFDEHGLFEHLKIHTIHCIIRETEMRQISSFNNIEKLHVWEILENHPVPEIVSLNELHIALGVLVSKDMMQSMAIKFKNL